MSILQRIKQTRPIVARMMVPELETELGIIEMSGVDYKIYADDQTKRREAGTANDATFERFLAGCLVDLDGNKVLPRYEDWPQLTQLSIKTLRLLFDMAVKANSVDEVSTIKNSSTPMA